MMKLLERIIEGKGSRIFLFRHYPAFNSFDPPPPGKCSHADDSMEARRVSPSRSSSVKVEEVTHQALTRSRTNASTGQIRTGIPP